MNYLTNLLVKIGVLKNDLDYHLLRASMVIIFFFFGCQKWFQYEAQALIPSRSPRFMLYVCRYCHDYPVYPEWLGCVRRRVPRYDRNSGINGQTSALAPSQQNT